MTRSRALVAAGVIIALSLIGGLIGASHSSTTARHLIPGESQPTSIALPRATLATDQMRFGPLTSDARARVRIQPAQAMAVAASWEDAGITARVLLVSLGGYVDTNDIIHDWIGTSSYVPVPTPAYVVSLAGLHVESLFGSGYSSRADVVVNAVTGQVIVSTLHG